MPEAAPPRFLPQAVTFAAEMTVLVLFGSVMLVLIGCAVLTVVRVVSWFALLLGFPAVAQ